MQVTMAFCVVTLVLAALGLYGVTAYSTSQRTSEFGLRAALGTEPGDVTRMVLGEAVRVTIMESSSGAGGPRGDAIDSNAAVWRRNSRSAVPQHRDCPAGHDGRRRELFAGETGGGGRAAGGAATRVMVGDRDTRLCSSGGVVRRGRTSCRQ